MDHEFTDRTELWDILGRLVSFDTVSNKSNLPVAAYVADLLSDVGFAIDSVAETVDGVEKTNLVAWAGPHSSDGLIVSGHLDVVPFEGQSNWKTDPLSVCSDGEKICGRGVSDMKGFLAQAIFLARRLPCSRFTRPLVLIFTCDEELACQGSARLIRRFPSLLGSRPLPGAALIGEPTNFEIYPAHKGYATLDVHVLGKGGHSSVPGQGLNAITWMANVVQVIREHNLRLRSEASRENEELFPECPYADFNPAIIMGGLAPNMIPDSCSLSISLRTPPGCDADRVIADLNTSLSRSIDAPMKDLVASAGVRIENLVIAPAMRSDVTHPFCRLLEDVMAQRATRGAPFATDAGHFRRLGLQTYVCGPGLLSQAHQPNESIPVANFISGTDRLHQVIARWCMA